MTTAEEHDHPSQPASPETELKTLAAEKAGALDTHDSVKTAADRMRAHDTAQWPVTEDRKLVGIVDQPDPDCELSRHGHDPQAWQVGQIMNRDAVFCYEDQDCQEARRLMEEHDLGYLPVVDREMRVVGIFSRDEIAAKPGPRRD